MKALKMIAVALSFTTALGYPGTAFAASQPSGRVAHWQNFAADPAYHTPEEAKADIANVLQRRGYSKSVAACVQEHVQAHQGVRVTLNKGDELDWMRSGMKGSIWGRTLVDFLRPPVDAKGVEYAVTAEEWTVECDGIVVTIGLPEVCNNLYGRGSPPPRRAEEECVIVQVQMHQGDDLLHGLFAKNGLPPSSCYAFKQADAAKWVELPSACVGPCDLTQFQSILGLRLENDGKAVIERDGFVQYRLPVIFAKSESVRAVFCATAAVSGQHSCGEGVKPENYHRSRKTGVLVATIAQDRASRKTGDRYFHWYGKCINPETDELIAATDPSSRSADAGGGYGYPNQPTR